MGKDQRRIMMERELYRQRGTPMTLAAFMARVKKRKDGCWEWTAGRKGTNYGTFKENGKMIDAHVWIYEHYKGAKRKGTCVCHKCDNRWCVRPAHLFNGTYQDNTRDAINKGRWMTQKRIDAIQLVGIKLKGRPAPNKGVPMKEISKRRLSKSITGRKLTPEQCLKFSIAAKAREERKRHATKI
jgi:hypothetical protein